MNQILLDNEKEFLLPLQEPKDTPGKDNSERRLVRLSLNTILFHNSGTQEVCLIFKVMESEGDMMLR